MSETPQVQITNQPMRFVTQGLPGAPAIEVDLVASQTGDVLKVVNSAGTKVWGIDVNGAQTQLSGVAGSNKQLVAPATGVSTTATNGMTITPTAGVMRYTNGGAITGVLMAAGTDGQFVTIANEGSGSITFAAVGTSLVANGVTTVISVLTARTLVYLANVVVPAWYTCSVS